MNKTLNLIFGICSLLGLITTLVLLNKTLIQIDLIGDQSEIYKSLAEIYKMLGLSVFALIAIFLIQSYLFNTNIEKLNRDLGELPLENKHLTDVNDYLRDVVNYHIRINRSTTDSIHNITHYYRYITILLRDTVIDLRKIDSKTDESECRKSYNEFEKFISLLLTSITSTIEVITQDECATCIKIINADKVKTFYRDPNSYRVRRESDYNQMGEIFIYNVADNFAFNLIADPHSKETFFVCDDLKEYKGYYNRNYEWNKLYNATIVVPIQANLSGNKHKKKMHILGFLCCDNMAGGLESMEIKDFLSASGDLLYNLFVLYDRFCLLSNDKGVSNEKLQDYVNWGSC
ncbi:hypothetical protein KAR91_32645 [Candidatus Pacearchaeota archaeon]|nr:hypothetical protein [Candidatus Pacearchaeota archaeon]